MLFRLSTSTTKGATVRNYSIEGFLTDLVVTDDAQARSELLAAAGSVDGLCDRAGKVTGAVRAELTR